MSTPLYYDLPGDKVTGTWSQTGGTVNANYPLTNIDDGLPWNPVIFTVNPTRITLDKGTATRTDIVSFIHTNFNLGAVINIQSNATNVWTSPTMSTQLVIAGPAEDNFPANPFSDRTIATGYTTAGLQFLSIQIVSGQSSLLSIGHVRVTRVKRQITGFASLYPRDLDFGGHFNEQHPLIERMTDAGVQLGYSRGTRARTVGGTLKVNETGWNDLVTWTRSTQGRFKPCLLIPYPDLNEAMFVKWGASANYILSRTRLEPASTYSVAVDWEEVGRGLAP